MTQAFDSTQQAQQFEMFIIKFYLFRKLNIYIQDQSTFLFLIDLIYQFVGKYIQLHLESQIERQSDRPMKSPKLDLERNKQILQNIDLLKQSWKFVPKHLLVIKNQQKKGIQGRILKKLRNKDATYQESTLEIITKNKNLYLAPVRDIQKIMKHFSRKFDDFKGNPQNQNISRKNKQRKTKSHAVRSHTSVQMRGQNGEQLIQTKITKLLELPTIKKANSQAQKIKALKMGQSQKKQLERQDILRKFEIYFSKETDLINRKGLIYTKQAEQQQRFERKRVKTSIQG